MPTLLESEMKVTIEITGHSGQVSESQLHEHLKEIANDIASYADSQQHEGYYRKIFVNYEVEEDINLNINCTVSE